MADKRVLTTPKGFPKKAKENGWRGGFVEGVKVCRAGINTEPLFAAMANFLTKRCTDLIAF